MKKYSPNYSLQPGILYKTTPNIETELTDPWQFQAVFLYSSPDGQSCPTNDVQMGQETLAIWAAIKKYSFT